MVKNLESFFSVFGASGYRYYFSLFSFDNIYGIEGAFPCDGAVYLLIRKVYDFMRLRFSYNLLHCAATGDLSSLSIGNLSKRIPKLLDANCIGVLYEKDAARREAIVTDILRRNPM